MYELLSDPNFRPPIDPMLLTTLRDLPPGSAEALAGQLGLTPEQFVTYANNHPGALSNLAMVAMDFRGPERLQRMVGELAMTSDQLAQLASAHPQALYMMTMAPDTSGIDSLLAIQARLGLEPGESSQLLMDLANTSGDLLGAVLDQAGRAIRDVQPGGDIRAALVQLRDAGAPSAGPDWIAAIDLVLQRMQ